MKEAKFVKINQEKWYELEKNPPKDPDILSERFVELTDDLSYARTFYPQSATEKYLNGLTKAFYAQIYKNKKEEKGRFLRFWKTELPTLFYHSHRELLVAFLVFIGATLIGAISAAHDETFVRLILGDSYVNTTIENIEKGDPMGIYKSSPQSLMFLQITSNNIKVAFYAFAMGIFFSFGTAYILFQNGVMLGAFQYFFYQKGFFLTSFLTIWIHGTLEISAIVIAGCAGFVIGNSLLFPKTYSRLESFKRGAKQGTKIVVGLVPIFIVAGFLESFVTRLPLHPAVSSSIIILSASFIIYYFIFYPIRLNKHRFSTEN